MEGEARRGDEEKEEEEEEKASGIYIYAVDGWMIDAASRSLLSVWPVSSRRK